MIKKMFFGGMLTVSLAMAYVYGLFSHKYLLPPFPQMMNMKNHLFPLSIGYSDVSSRTEVPCESVKRKRLMVALVFGQSNSGNHGETLYSPKEEVYSLYRGRCYKAKDPLPGNTGDRGSVWTRLADRLIAGGLYDRVILIPIGVGTTTMEQWTRGGYLYPRIVNAVRESEEKGLAITHLLWVQGGSEKRTAGDIANKEQYKKNFLLMLRGMRDLGVDAPVYVAVATYSDSGVIRDIQDAQKELVDEGDMIYAGPNGDDLYENKKNVWDRVHLSHRGLEMFADAWFRAIQKAEGKH